MNSGEKEVSFLTALAPLRNQEQSERKSGVKKSSPLEPSATEFVTGSQDGHHYPTWWKSDLVKAIDGLLQSGSSPEEAYSRVAHDLQAQHFSLSVEEIQRLYCVFKQELAILDSWKKTMRRSGRVGMVRYQETVKESVTPDKQIRDNSAILEAELRLKNLDDTTEDPTTALQEIAQSLPFLSRDEKGHLAMLSSEVAKKLGAVTSGETQKILRQAYEQQGNLPALGAAAGQDTPQEWALRGLHEATKRGIRIPTQGRGRRRITSDDEKRAQGRSRKADSDDRVKKARQALREAITHEKQKLPRAITRDSARRQEAYKEIEDRLIEQWCSHRDADRRKAGEKEKVLILRQRNRKKW